MQVMTSPYYPWDNIHHRSYYLPQATKPSLPISNQFTIETKDFVPSGYIDWFQNPILTLDAFQERNMANISPTIQIDISLIDRVIENIGVGAPCSPTEIRDIKHLFQEFRDIFAWSYTKMPSIDRTIMEHHIDTWPNARPIRQK